MAGVDLNRESDPTETRERGSVPVRQWQAGARGWGHRARGSGRTVADTPERTNALWFFVALIGGGIGIWLTKSIAASSWVAAMVAVGVILALMIYYMLNDEDAPEEEGDNVYYLGLLFTLVSLMFAIVELFGFDKGVNTEKIPELLKSFGIALTSTVMEIAGRVAVQNWQRADVAGRSGFSENLEFVEDAAFPVLPPEGANPRDLERFNRQLLGRISRDLTQGANALARFHRIVRSHASDTEEYLRNHGETLKRQSTRFRDTLQRNSEAFAQDLKAEIEKTLGAVGDSVNAVAKEAEVLPDRLRSAHDAYLAEVHETTRSFHGEIRSASDQSLDTLRQNFDAAAKQSLSLTQNVSSIHERIGEVFDRLGSGLEHASEAGVAFGNSAGQAAKSTIAMEEEIHKLRTALSAVQGGAETVARVLDAVGELDARIRADRDMEQTTEEARRTGETLVALTAEATTATERAAEAAALFDAFTQSIRTIEGETRRMAGALHVLADEAEARVESLRQHEGSAWRFWNRNQ